MSNEKRSGYGVDVAERTVVVDTTQVKYFVAGTAKDGFAPIVLVHGTCGSTRVHYGYLLPMFARDFRVISVDLSEPRDIGVEGVTVEQLERQVAAVIEAEVPGGKVGLLGYSLGAVVAAALAGHRPDLVDRLVLVSGWIKTDAQQLLRNGIWQTLRKEGSHALREYTVSCALSGDVQTLTQPEDLNRFIESIQTDAFTDQLMDLNKRVDISEAVEAIQMPTLVIGCSDDQMVPTRHSKALFGAIDDARYFEITSGHAVMQERPAEVLRAASGFFDNPTLHPAGTIIEIARP